MSTENLTRTAAAPSVFTGWSHDATAFLAEIAADNSAEFWAAQRHRHASSVLPPVRALAAALEPEFGALRILRPYRNRRFRPDASPYRTDAGGVVATPGGTEFSVLLAAAGLSVRVGHHEFDGAQLRRYREAVAGEPGSGLTEILDALDGAGLALGAVPSLRGQPRGFTAEHPRIALLRLRGLHVGRAWPAGPWLDTPEPLAAVAGAWRAARPLARWLDEHVGAAAPR
jgi:uncharacterized protein (DUF2461 family)